MRTWPRTDGRTALRTIDRTNVGVPVDPYFSSTVLLLPGDGTNGAQNNTFLDGSTNNFTITRNGNTTQGTFSPFALASGTAWSAATNGGSGFFDGSGDYLSVANNAALDMASTFSLEFWIYRTNGNDQMYVARGGGAANWNATNGYQYACFISSGTFYFQFNSGGSAVALVATATLPALNAWTHVAVARDGTTMRIWINGTSVGTSASSPTVPSTTNLTYIGQDIAGGSFAYAGYLSGYRFLKNSAAYDASQTTITVPTAPLTAITNTSLLLNFTNAGIYDATAKNDLETVGDAQISTAQSKWGGSSMYFDGTGDSLVCPFADRLAFGTGDFTIEYWIRTSATAASLLHPSTTGSGYWSNFINTSTFWWQSSNQTTNLKSTSATPIIDGNWHHVAIVRYSGTMNFYFDGVVQGSGTADSTNYSGTAGTLRIGGSGAYISDLNGYIDDLRITKGVARYTAAFPPPTAAFPLR